MIRVPVKYSKRGFTLAEVITAVAILSLIMVAVSAFQYNVLSYNRIAEVSLTNAQEAQALIKTISKELRATQQSANGAYPIAAAATSTITFFSDTDRDGNEEQVRYYLASSTLYRGIIRPTGSPLTYTGSESTKILATGLRNSSTTPVFEYFDSTYAGTSSPMTYPITITNIRLVKVNLTIDTDPSRAPVLRTFTTQTVLRNLKDNL
ncbi:MAG: prepilin-type N-terminal cleavage/methylation domain-containing protein [Candidatus Pacebacteria bacterium]|nr:prepilin-type N-terminal cleavage/methylation domain-containing protein [Candidatus Paceibacterota bacterium]